MRNFFPFGLALVLVFFGAMALSHVPKGVTASDDLSIGRVANLISGELTDSNAVEQNGVQFEILVSERVLTIPPNQPAAKTPVQFGLKITNKSQTPFQFSRFDTLSLEMINPNGGKPRWMQRRRGTTPPTDADFPLLQPNESVTFFLDGELRWLKNELWLRGPDGFGGEWYFDEALKPGAYRIRLRYTAYPSDSGPTEIWRGQVATPFVELRLIQS